MESRLYSAKVHFDQVCWPIDQLNRTDNFWKRVLEVFEGKGNNHTCRAIIAHKRTFTVIVQPYSRPLWNWPPLVICAPAKAPAILHIPGVSDVGLFIKISVLEGISSIQGKFTTGGHPFRARTKQHTWLHPGWKNPIDKDKLLLKHHPCPPIPVRE